MGTLIDVVTWITAFDGGKALVWRNDGFARRPDLKLIDERQVENPPTREQGADRPGRRADPGHGRSSVGETDFHGRTKAEFLRMMVERLNRSAARGEFERLVVCAPATALGMARKHYSPTLAERVVERVVDIVHAPTERVEAEIRQALWLDG